MTPFVNQRVDGFEALPKLAPHHYFSIFPGIRDKLTWKKSASVIFEIFRLFVNTLTPDDKYSRRKMQIFWQQLQATFPQKERLLVDICLYFWNAHEIYNVLKNKKSILV